MGGGAHDAVERCTLQGDSGPLAAQACSLGPLLSSTTIKQGLCIPWRGHLQTGTPEYVAPEMWLRQPYSYPADVWALGCILQELCSLK